MLENNSPQKKKIAGYTARATLQRKKVKYTPHKVFEMAKRVSRKRTLKRRFKDPPPHPTPLPKTRCRGPLPISLSEGVVGLGASFEF